MKYLIFFAAFSLSLGYQVKAHDDLSKAEDTPLLSSASYHSFCINNDFHSSQSGSDEDVETQESHEDLQPARSRPEIYIFPMARPHYNRERKVDYYLFQPLLYCGTSIFCVGLMETIYYQNIDSGLVPLEIGLGITATSLACKALGHWSSGILDYFHQRSERQMLQKIPAKTLDV